MSAFRNAPIKPGVFTTAKRFLRESARGINGSGNGLKSISENRPLTATERTLDPEKDGFIPSGTTGASPQDAPKDVEEDDRERRRDVRTIPPWIHSYEEGEDDTEADVRSYLLPNVPATTQPPHHPYVPNPKPNAEKGRKFDHGRSWEPDIMRTPLPLTASHWQSFGPQGTAPKNLNDHGMLAAEEWQKENLRDLEGPWNPDGSGSHLNGDQGWWLFSSERRAATFTHIHRILMQNPFVPLGLRVMVMIFVLCALAVGATIFERTKVVNDSPFNRQSVNLGPSSDDEAVCEQQPSTYMAFIVDSFAILYLFYITWDEYFSKPLGLRRSRDKMRLLFLDLVFIVFSAANLSLAFNTLLDAQWACFKSPASNQLNLQAAQSVCVKDADLCRRQQTLAGVLLIVLVAWLMTFAVSCLRVVERISR